MFAIFVQRAVPLAGLILVTLGLWRAGRDGATGNVRASGFFIANLGAPISRRALAPGSYCNSREPGASARRLMNGSDAAVTGAASPAAPVKAAIYDPDPAHLWNRLHRALWLRTAPGGKEYGHDRLDPLLWSESNDLVNGKPHQQVIAVLDEFLKSHGETLVKYPLKRAILQRDLWALFDWAAEPGAKTREAYLRRSPASRRALQKRLARTIQRLALSPEQIKALPDNYAAAVASRAFATKYDPRHPERPYLPPDLFQKDGPWVEVGADNSSRVIATRHVYDFGARSAFRVFLRFPDGRKATVAYFAKLRDFPRPWVLVREARRKTDAQVLNPDLPQFPAGTQTALVRQMLVINKDGRIVPTRVAESVQIRVFRSIPKRKPNEGRRRGEAPDQDFYEFTRSRGLLFAGKNGGLRGVGRDEKDFNTQLLTLPADELETGGKPQVTLRRCIGCHDRPGIHSFRSFTGGVYPRGHFDLPSLQANSDPQGEAELSAMRKREQFDWGLLQGLWKDQPARR